jgi:hypothetical protein
MDPAPERIRAVRDKRFKYVRNYRPDLPYLGFVPYRDQAPIMQSIHRTIKAGDISPDQWQLTGTKKPLEELYDTENDPHEIHNLASDPKFFEKLAELRDAHKDWKKRFGDLGELPESELIKKLWPPNGEQPSTADPVVEVSVDKVVLSCLSEGASIAYRVLIEADSNEEQGWKLYSKPLLYPGKNLILQVQAIRYGWKKSRIIEVKLR